MKNNYVDNKQFLALLIECDKTGSRVAYEKIGKIFQLIARNFLNKPNFINYTQDRKEEMESDGVFLMLRYMKNFDLTKKNPFSYFTMIAFNSFLQNIKKYKNKQNMFVSLDFNENLNYVNQTECWSDK